MAAARDGTASLLRMLLTCRSTVRSLRTLAYLRVLDNPEDTVWLRRILNTPRRGIGDRAEAAHAERERISFAAALRAAAAGQEIPLLNSRSPNAITAFVVLMDELREKVTAARGLRRSSKRCSSAPVTRQSWTCRRTHRMLPGWTTSPSW